MNRTQFRNMLQKQADLNKLVSGKDWIHQDLPWSTALWLECAELLETTDWKWWKNTQFDRDKFIAELIDVWHFGMSLLMVRWPDFEVDHDSLVIYVNNLYKAGGTQKPESIISDVEQLARVALGGYFALPSFFRIMNEVDLSVDQLYTRYTAKHALNQFRQENGYKTKDYRWSTKQDTQHLDDIVHQIDGRVGLIGNLDVERFVIDELNSRYNT